MGATSNSLPLTFFFDNTHSPNLARALNNLDTANTVAHILDCPSQFPAGGATDDLVWIPTVGGLGWKVVTGDGRILTRPKQVEALVAAHVTAFFMPKGFQNIEILAQARLFMGCWADLVQKASTASVGECYELTMHGKIASLGVPRRR